MEPYYYDDDCIVFNADCRDVLPELSADALITDPPFGVGLIARQARDAKGNANHAIAPASTLYNDDPDDIAQLIKEVIPVALSRVDRALIFSGYAMLWNYPPADVVGGVYIPSAVSYTPWGFATAQPILFYGKDPSKGRTPNGFVWNGGRSEVYDHPCPKPLKWMTWAVEKASRPGETVLDCFAGTGTTAVAAKQCGRKSICIEVEEMYCKIIVKRLAQQTLDLTYNEVI